MGHVPRKCNDLIPYFFQVIRKLKSGETQAATEAQSPSETASSDNSATNEVISLFFDLPKIITFYTLLFFAFFTFYTFILLPVQYNKVNSF